MELPKDAQRLSVLDELFRVHQHPQRVQTARLGGRGPSTGLAKSGGKNSNFRSRFGPKRQIDGLSRCHGWIGVEKLPLFHLLRAPTDVWDPFFEHVAQKCEGFSKLV